MATTRPTQSRLLRRTGAGLLAGAAASVALTMAPATATAAEPAPAQQQAAPAPAESPAARTAVDTAYAQVGKPYQYGGAGPDSFDCSGLTQFAYRAAGIELPHSSRGQSEIGTPVAPLDLLPGDLVFYYEPVSHVGIYIGDGQIVHAGTEATGVEITSVSMEGYNHARRIA